MSEPVDFVGGTESSDSATSYTIPRFALPWELTGGLPEGFRRSLTSMVSDKQGSSYLICCFQDFARGTEYSEGLLSRCAHLGRRLQD